MLLNFGLAFQAQKCKFNVAYIIIQLSPIHKLMAKSRLKATQLSLTVLVLLALLICGSNGQCFGENCRMVLKQNNGEKYTLAQIVKAIDQEIRRVYWYYLKDAIQIFQTNFQSPNKETLHFYIYRNRVGTFLAVISKKKSTLEVNVNSFARLGNGFTENSPTKTQPMSIQPYIISLKLSPFELILEDSPQNKTSQEVNTTSNLSAVASNKNQLQENKNKIDQYLRKTYWYYLDKAYLMSTNTLLTNQKLYVILTYINITGTYMVMASIDDKTTDIKVNTFLRLGAGSSTNDVKPIVVQPKLIGLG